MTVTPGDLVTRMVEELELQDKLAQQLGRAISKSLNRPGWGGHQFIVETERDGPRAWYSVRISDRDPWTTHLPRNYAVYDETLREYTASVATFHEWVRAAGQRLALPFGPAPRPEDEAKHRARLEAAEEELESFGFHRLDGAVLPPELEAAVASIKRALDVHQDR